MNRRLSFIIVVLLPALLVGGNNSFGFSILDFGVASAYGPRSESPLAAVGSGITYQGLLVNTGNGNPATGRYDFTFKLFDAAAEGNQVGPTINQTNQNVAGGIFLVNLDFGNTAFLGDARYLEIAVAEAGGSLTTLSPRVLLTSNPYAMSVPWFGVSGKPSVYNPLRLTNATPTADGSGGTETSITIGADGLPLISYYDSSNHPRVAHCEDVACGSVTTSTLDTNGTTGRFTSVTMGSDSLPLISYYDVNGGNLNVAHCGNAACTSAGVVTTTLDATGDVGQYTSVAVGADGWGLISYYDVTNGDLKVAHCADTACAGAPTLRTLDSTGDVGQYTSVAVGADGLPLISYYDATLGPSGGNLNVAHCGDAACTSVITTTLDATGDVGRYTSVAIGADRLGLISYYDVTNGDLKVAHCGNVTCTSVNTTTRDSPGDVGDYTSLTIGSDGLGLIAYHDITNDDLKVAHCQVVTCTAATSYRLASSGSVGRHTSVTVGVDGLPLIGYLDGAVLRALHCGSPLCVAYQHRR